MPSALALMKPSRACGAAVSGAVSSENFRSSVLPAENSGSEVPAPSAPEDQAGMKPHFSRRRPPGQATGPGGPGAIF